jgi:tetratricopeptide (TPR) repeat protein
VIALGALAFAAVGYATARALGIGPAGTLLSSGVVGAEDRFVLADFANRTPDSSLGTSVTEALRVDLGQSRVVRILSDREVATALTRMTLLSGTPLTDSIAIDLARREGAKAVISGEVQTLGSGFVLTGRVIEAATGETRAAVRATASDAGQLLSALNDLSGQLRERIGESLRSIRASEPLDQVTTRSMVALQHYSVGSRIFATGNMEEAVVELRKAVEADSQFAMAWRRLASALGNLGAPRSQVVEATRRAFQERDRLTPLERALTEATYYRNVEPDLERSIAAHRAALAIDSLNTIANNNLGLVLNQLERFAEAEVPLRRQLLKEPSRSLYINLANSLTAQGKWAEAESLAQDAEHHLPAATTLPAGIRSTAARRARDFRRMDSLQIPFRGQRLDAVSQEGFDFAEVDANIALGRHAAALDQLDRIAARKAASDPAEALELALSRAFDAVILDGDRVASRRHLADAMRRYPVEQIPMADRPHGALGSLYSWLGDLDAVRRMRRERTASIPAAERTPQDSVFWDAREALARGDLRETIRLRREAARLGNCARCPLYDEAAFWDRLGLPDSARVALERAVTTHPTDKDEPEDTYFYAPALRRLGELAEVRGDRVAARDYYQRFVDVWRDADPKFQPQVAEARRRLAALGSDAPRP